MEPGKSMGRRKFPPARPEKPAAPGDGSSRRHAPPGAADLEAAREMLRMETAGRKKAQEALVGAQEQLKRSLAEKDALLKEVHHRVKNNLQIISTLLQLQADYIRDEEDRKIFKESQNRVKSMALIHEKLYRSRDLARIDFADYVNDLVSHLFYSFGAAEKKLSFGIESEDILMGVDAAIPGGLIINELVSNSLKYAFPLGQGGKIFVGLSTGEKGRFALVVGDDGVGLPRGLDFRRTETLGLQLVCLLTDQLGGKIELAPGPGTVFRIDFPETAR